jgi:hypothetical protein
MNLIGLRCRFLLLFTLGSTLSAAPFLVPDRSYHCDADQIRKATYTLNFVEFRDSGAPFCPDQLIHALGQIDKARSDNERIVVLVYIHGWKNNASEELSDDVAKFQKEIDRLSLVLPRPDGNKQPSMVGIYLAWRGLTLTIEPFKTLSYWPRRAVARHVGRTGMFDAVGRIVDEVGAARSRTTLIFVGHSFGARVLENTADAADGQPQRQGFMNRHLELIKSRQQPQSNSPSAVATTGPLPPADMIIYANAATSSTVTRHTIKEWTRICKNEPDLAVCRAHPFWLAFTSTADFPTGVIMPVANAVFPALSSDGLRLISAANSPWLHTHDVHEEKCKDNRKPDDFRCPVGSTADACFGALRDESKYCYEINRIKPSEPDPPFWIMNVNGHVVKDHGDIWNENVINMILSIMQKQRLMKDLFSQNPTTR